jgi:hypothetical protein
MTDSPKGSSKAAPEAQHQTDPSLSRDATHSTYTENTDPNLDVLDPPTGGHVEQELGLPVETPSTKR